MSKKLDNPVQTYAVVSQVAFMVITPLLLFIGGGSWLINRFALPSWLMIVFIVLGIGVMVSSVGTYLMKIAKMCDDGKKDEYSRLKHDKRDHDY